ncbi:MAG TPA: hypothetical protein VF710_24875 [Longimicrobium sp.]|jgi:hypothetical protein
MGYVFAGFGASMLLLLLVNGRLRVHLALTTCATLVAGLAIVAGERGHPARRWLWLLFAAAAGARVLLFPSDWGW